MSKIGTEGRSYRVISQDDLRRLAEIARKDWEQFFQEHPEWDEVYGQIVYRALPRGGPPLPRWQDRD